jgi:hypothetical protein
MAKQVVTEIKTVTPTMCVNWLEANLNNRPLNQRHVNLLTRTMAKGDWDMNGESLKFDEDKNILDGQHRMWACIESNVSFKTMLVHGLPRGTFDTIDTGRIRAAHDVLAMRGEKDVLLLNGILKHIGRYHAGQMLSTGKITNKEVEDLLEQYPKARDHAHTLGRAAYRVRWCAPSIMGTCWFLAAQKNKAQAEVFFNGLIFGADLTTGSPVLALRNKFIDIHSHKGQHLSTPMKMEMIVNTWNAFRAGKTINHFKMQGLARESSKFPKFK